MDVAPRVLMLTSRADTWVTLTPGTARSRSPMFVAGEFWMVALLMMLTAAGALTSCSSTREAVTTTCSSNAGGASAAGGAAGWLLALRLTSLAGRGKIGDEHADSY